MIEYTRNKLVFFKEKLGLPLGPKGNIKIPEWIMNSGEFKKACLAGIFATDGCLLFQKKHKSYPYYPQLSISSKSGPLIKQIGLILTDIGIKASINCEKIKLPRRPNPIWKIYFYGKKHLYKFIDFVGLINSKHEDRLIKWKRDVEGGI